MSGARALIATAVLVFAPSLTAQTLTLTGADTLGCTEVEGHFVGFLRPGSGIVVFATQPFPGGEPAGSIRDGWLAATLPGLGDVGVTARAPEGTSVWALLDRSLEPSENKGCFGFGPKRFSTEDDFKTYIHWFVREVLAKVPAAPGRDPSVTHGPSVWLANRRVTLEILAVDHRTISLRATEGSTLGFALPDSAATLFLQPFVLGRAARSVAVRVSLKRGDFFGPGITEEIAFVLTGPDEISELPTEPRLGLRLAAIEDRVLFDN